MYSYIVYIYTPGFNLRPQVDPASDWRLFCKVHAHDSVVERLGHAAELEVCIHWPTSREKVPKVQTNIHN